MKSYKHRNGHVVFRSGNGRFRKTTMEDIGINNANKEGKVFICNVCEREFVPVVLSGKCCGVDNKREKEIIVTTEEREIMNQIDQLRKQPFISRKNLEEIAALDIQLTRLRSTLKSK